MLAGAPDRAGRAAVIPLQLGCFRRDAHLTPARCSGNRHGNALAVAAWVVDWPDLWSTPDQRGRRLMQEQRYAEAAASFADPMWFGVPEFKAGNFKEAAQIFGMDMPEAAFDQGNALVMLGKYDEAIARYDGALSSTSRPWRARVPDLIVLLDADQFIG
jgi:tetratricopeptide (TPR) repeat protein